MGFCHGGHVQLAKATELIIIKFPGFVTFTLSYTFYHRWFRFVSLISFRFVSFLLISFRFVSFSLISFRFVSFRFYFVSHFIGTPDWSQYFNPSKNYWFSFNAFLISLIGLYFRCLSSRVVLVNTARPDGAFLFVVWFIHSLKTYDSTVHDEKFGFHAGGI